MKDHTQFVTTNNKLSILSNQELGLLFNNKVYFCSMSDVECVQTKNPPWVIKTKLFPRN